MTLDTRLARIWRAMGAWDRRDPTLFLAAFAAWQGFSGASLLYSRNTFSLSPIYSVAFDLGLPDNWIGYAMLVNAATVLWGLGERPPHVRAAIAILTGVLWCFWSFITFAGGLKVGLVSANSMWTFWAALCVMRTGSARASAWTGAAPEAARPDLDWNAADAVQRGTAAPEQEGC